MSVLPQELIRRLSDEYVGSGPIYAPNKPGVSPSVDSREAEHHMMNPMVAAAAEQYFDNPDRLYGDRVNTVAVVHERPIHRMMVYLSASGASVNDIAAQTGYSLGAIRAVLAQPWARQRLVQILNETGRDRVKHFLTNEVAPSLDVLREVRDDRTARESARIAACNAILDRALGKPTVHVESDNTNRTVPVEAARIDAELASVRKQLVAKGVEQPAPVMN